MDDLLAAARAGDARAYGALAATCRNVMWAVALQVTGNHADAEDALQDALTSAWQNLHRFRGDSGFQSWMYQITRNAALQIIRKRGEATSSIDDLEIESQSSPVANRVVDVDAVRWALDQLTEEFRQALTLREFGDLSYAEIAEIQGVPIQTVRSRINRARTRVVEMLRPTELS